MKDMERTTDWTMDKNHKISVDLKRKPKERKKIVSIILVFLLHILVSVNLYSGKALELNLKNVLAIGKGDLIFSSIASVYEDGSNNFFVLDKKACKVYKFSPEGKLLLSFGQKGQGPGDFESPYDLFVTDSGEIVVSEERSYVSFFDKDGEFLKRLVLNKGLALTYMNEDLYYAWIWEPAQRKQILIDSNSDIVKSFFTVSIDSHSISLPDETGRMVMFNYSTEEYTPFLLFSRYKNRSAIGVGNLYEISILDENGVEISKIKRNINPQKLSSKEKKYLRKKIGETRNWPDWVLKKIEKRIPKVKNYFDRIIVAEKYVFVFGIKNDVTDEQGLIPVDVFTMEGKLLGISRISTKPILISDKFFYFSEIDPDDDLILTKYRYHLRENK
jgi:hypothetical protein